MLGRGNRNDRPLGGQGGQLNTMDVELGLCKGRAEASLVFWVSAATCRAVQCCRPRESLLCSKDSAAAWPVEGRGRRQLPFLSI